MNREIDKRRTGNILFCGAFQAPANGTKGGILYACQCLLATKTAKTQSWVLIDSAQPLPPPWIGLRLSLAAKRWFHAVSCLLFGRICSTLVFTPFLTLSLLEKLSICLISTLLGRPTVVAFRSEIVTADRSRWFLRPFLASTLKRISYVICQSEEARNALETLVPDVGSKIRVIPNWTIIESVTPTPASSNCRNTDDICRISYIGWLEPIKGIPTIIHALKQVDCESSGWELSICGSGSQLNELQQLVNELQLENQVRFRGWIDSDTKEELLRQTDLFAMASLSEGMPNSLVEAMAHGVAVVSSDVGGIPSLVTQEVNGLLFPARDIEAAKICFQRLICDRELRRDMGVRNRKKIAASHNAEDAAIQIVRLLDPNFEIPTSV